MNNFNYSSDYHFGPLNAFSPFCHTGWHRGLCYQRTLLSSPLWKQAFPPHSRSFLWPWEDPTAVETIAQLVFMALGKCSVVGQGRNGQGWAEILGVWAESESLHCKIMIPPRLLQPCPTWAARAPPRVRTTWPTVTIFRRVHSGIKTSWRNSTALWPLLPSWNLSARKGRSCGHCTSITGSTILESGYWPPLAAGPHCRAWLARWWPGYRSRSPGVYAKWRGSSCLKG